MSSSLGNIPRKCLEKLKTLWYSPIVGQKNGLFKLSRFSFSGTADCQVIDRLAAKINTIQGLVKVCKKNFFAKFFFAATRRALPLRVLEADYNFAVRSIAGTFAPPRNT
jgi:hypothetical protein